ncbi:MAG: DNA primase, partial [Candidatus Bathyarchaeota archaeon]|nr:DNA primase [Candidatus Bathyarchaeota archaeon]
VARAPRGMEVEDLTSREIVEALEKRVPIEKAEQKAKKRRRVLVPDQIIQAAKELRGTFEAILLNSNMDEVARLPVSQLADKLKEFDGVDTVVFDGVITQRIIDIASEKDVKYLVAARTSDIVKEPLNVHLLTFDKLLD